MLGRLFLRIYINTSKKIKVKLRSTKKFVSFPSWWFQPTHLKNMSQIGSFPQIVVKIPKIFEKRHHLVSLVDAKGCPHQTTSSFYRVVPPMEARSTPSSPGSCEKDHRPAPNEARSQVGCLRCGLTQQGAEGGFSLFPSKIWMGPNPNGPLRRLLELLNTQV